MSADGSCHPIPLVSPLSKSKSRNLELCLICQHSKDGNGPSQLTSTEEGRQVVIETSEKLQDGFLDGIDPSELTRIQYHSKSCYASFRRKGQRHIPEAAKRKFKNEDDSEPS